MTTETLICGNGGSLRFVDIYRKETWIIISKDQTIFEHKHSVIYHGKCPAENIADDYIKETACRVNERIVDHTGRDTNSHLLKHSIGGGHKSLDVNYKIIGRGYCKNTMKRISIVC